MSEAIERRQFARALLIAFHLNEDDCISAAIHACPVDSIPVLASAVPLSFLTRFLDVCATKLAPGTAASPYVEFFLRWTLALLTAHGRAFKERPSYFQASLRNIHKALLAHKDALSKMYVWVTRTLSLTLAHMHASVAAHRVRPTVQDADQPLHAALLDVQRKCGGGRG